MGEYARCLVVATALAEDLAGGQDVYRIDADGWTIRSGDGSRAAHVEHTVAVTEDGPQVLTVL